MANTFKAIATVTVGSGGASSIDFTSIPSTYTDLVIKLSGRTTNANLQDYLAMQFNGSGGTAYSHSDLTGNGSSAQSTIQTGLDRYYFTYVLNGATSTSNTFSNVDVYIPNYASSNYKSISSDGVPENNTTGITYTTLSAGLWSSTAAITSINFVASGSFVQYSTATLYGIKNS